MKNFYLFTLSLLLFFSFTSCKKDAKNTSSSDIVIAKEAKVINAQTWHDNFVSMDSTTNTITFSKNINSSQQIKTGDIIVSGDGDGVLRKVTTVTTNNNQIQVQTEPAYLTEVISQGLIQFDQVLTLPNVKSIKYHYDGIQLHNDVLKSAQQNNSGMGWDINAVLYDEDNNLSTKNDQIRLKGGFTCDWHIVGKVDIGMVGLKEVNFGFESNENMQLRVETQTKFSFTKDYNLATVTFSPIVVNVGGIPVIFTPVLNIIAGISGSAQDTIYCGLNQSLSFNAGIKWLKDKGWAPYHTNSKSLDYSGRLDVNANFEAYIKPELTLKVYGVAGPFVDSKIYGRVAASLLPTAWYGAYGGFKLNSGVRINLLDKIMLDYTSNDLISYEQLISQSGSH